MLGWILFAVLAYFNIGLVSTAINCEYDTEPFAREVVAKGIFWPVLLGLYLYNCLMFVIYNDEKYLN